MRTSRLASHTSSCSTARINPNARHNPPPHPPHPPGKWVLTDDVSDMAENVGFIISRTAATLPTAPGLGWQYVAEGDGRWHHDTGIECVDDWHMDEDGDGGGDADANVDTGDDDAYGGDRGGGGGKRRRVTTTDGALTSEEASEGRGRDLFDSTFDAQTATAMVVEGWVLAPPPYGSWSRTRRFVREGGAGQRRGQPTSTHHRPNSSVLGLRGTHRRVHRGALASVR